MEATIGFDLRSTLGRQLDRGPENSYLLRREGAAVCSVDPIAWVRPPGFPSVAGTGGAVV